VNLLQGLLDGVRNFLQIDFADNVKAVIGHRISFVSEMMESNTYKVTEELSGKEGYCMETLLSAISASLKKL
jgi:hypothetical protein